MGHYLPFRLEVGKRWSLGDVVRRHCLLSPQPVLKDGPFPAQVKAEFRVRPQLVFICTAGNKSVFLLSFYEIPIPGCLLLQLAGTSPPLARGLCSWVEAEPRRQTSIWQPAQTRGRRSECLGAGRAAGGDRDFLTGGQRLPRRWQICFRTFLPLGTVKISAVGALLLACWCTPATGMQTSGVVQGGEENRSNSLFLTGFAFSLFQY